MNQVKSEQQMNDEKIKNILSARRRAYEAGVALLECDDEYARRVKMELEQYVLANRTASSVSSDDERFIDESDIQIYFEMWHRIYLRVENITFNAERTLCLIRLNPRLEATLPIKEERAVRSILAGRRDIR